MEFYHVMSRGVDKREIFKNNDDYFRFMNNLFLLNDSSRVNNVYYLNQYNDIASHYMSHERDLLVDVLAFCLMPNHFHILLSPRDVGNISHFMKKINMAYAKYFNIKYQREGALFQGRYKSVAINKEAHFSHMPFYIHCNPLDLYSPEWRDLKLKNLNDSIKFLKNYKWSSHNTYMGEPIFSHIINTELLDDYFEGPSGYRVKITDWLKDLNVEYLKDITLE